MNTVIIKACGSLKNVEINAVENVTNIRQQFFQRSTSSRSFCVFSYQTQVAILMISWQFRVIARRTREYKKLLLVKKKLLSDINNIFNRVHFYILQRSIDYNVKKDISIQSWSGQNCYESYGLRTKFEYQNVLFTFVFYFSQPVLSTFQLR